VNTGREVLHPGDVLVWDLPDADPRANMHLEGQPADKFQFVVRPLRSELAKTGVTVGHLRNYLFGRAADPISQSARGRDHLDSAAESIAMFAGSQHVLGLERYAQALDLVKTPEDDFDPANAEDRLKLDVRNTLLDARLDGADSGYEFGRGDVRKDNQIIAGLLDVTEDNSHSRTFSVWWLRFALYAHEYDDDFPASRAAGSREPRRDWRGDMLKQQRNGLARVLSAVESAHMEVRRRIIGTALNYSQPGQYVDVLLGSASF
jgi:hypothetical protein